MVVKGSWSFNVVTVEWAAYLTQKPCYELQLVKIQVVKIGSLFQQKYSPDQNISSYQVQNTKVEILGCGK